MNNYNDFPILNEEQYLKLSEQYNLKNLAPTSKQSLTQQIFNLLNFSIKSLININHNLNTNISEKMNNHIKKLNDIYDSFKFLYPSIKNNQNEQTDNIFFALSRLTESANATQELIAVEDKKYYKSNLARLQNKLMTALSEILMTLSKLSYKTFKHF